VASCLDIVKGAMIKAGVLASGREPRLADREDVLAVLAGMYRTWITAGAFGRLRDVIPLANYTAGENERIFRNQSALLIVTLPETVAKQAFWSDFSIYGQYNQEVMATTPVSDQRPPRDCAVVTVIDAFVPADIRSNGMGYMRF
jgi:hypothetical protein